MTQGTAVAKTDRKQTEIIREGANLPADTWGEARIAAVAKLLPSEFRDAPSTIALLARAQRSGLDPFIQEIHAWKNERGDLQFYTARDGWLRIARNDEGVESLEFGLVYEGDEFEWEQEGEYIAIHHKGSGFGQGSTDIVGAYCVAHMVEGADHLERRVPNDYKHLMGKFNWKNALADMLLTRAVSACVKFVSPLGNGIEAPPDQAFGFDPEPRRPAPDMNDKTAALSASLRGEAVEAEAEIVDEDGEDDPPEEGEDEETPDPAAAFDHFCPFCGQAFESGRALGGHSSSHKQERAMQEQLPEDWRVMADVEGEKVTIVAYHKPTGEIVEERTDLEGAVHPFEDWMDAARWVLDQVEDEEAGAPEEEDHVAGMQAAHSDAEAELDKAQGGQRWTVTRIQAFIARNPSIGPQGLQSLLDEKYPERLREGRDTVSVFDLSAEERNELGAVLEQMADAQSEGL